jgi:hypothetical protein
MKLYTDLLRVWAIACMAGTSPLRDVGEHELTVFSHMHECIHTYNTNPISRQRTSWSHVTLDVS